MQKNFLMYVNNCFNDTKREAYAEVKEKLLVAGKLTEDVKVVLDEMLGSVKNNKKLKKPSKPRFSGYHLFLKERRVEIKAEQPGILPQDLTRVVSKAWGGVSEYDKKTYATRALEMKTIYEAEHGEPEENALATKKRVKDKKATEAKKALLEPVQESTKGDILLSSDE